MPPIDHTFRYIGIAAIVLLVFGLVGWYMFISRQTSELAASDAARGFGIDVPSFGGSRGSTLENIASGFGARLDEGEATSETKPVPRLWNISPTPVAGFAFVESGTSSIVRFVERSTGHVFDADPATGRVTRRTNTLMPKIYDARIAGEAIIERFLEDGVPVTFVGHFGTTSVDGFLPLEGKNLGGDIVDIAVSTSSIVFLAHDKESTRLIRANHDGTEPKELVSFAAGDFTLSLFPQRAVLVERAASNIGGNAYQVEGDGSITALARAVPGLTLVAHPSHEATLIGTDDGSRLSLSLHSSHHGAILDLGLQTVADKCAWAPAPEEAASSTALKAFCAVPQAVPSPDFLDTWYRGAVHTTDSWYRIDAGAGKAEEFFAMHNVISLDVERPLVDASGTYIAFMNMSDKSLWLLRIPE